MLPLTRSRNRSRFFPPFSPASLFSAGEQGAWYDPSDFSTLFTDSAGTTPVTAVEQFVGLMLDKSGRGNHATQTTSAKRPKLAARYNLLTYTEQFDNAAWTKLNATAANTTATTDPLGGTTAEKLYPTSTGTSRFLYQILSVASGLYRWSLAAKAAEKSIVYIDLTGAGTTHAYFDLNAGTIGNVAAGYAASISPLGNGWYRCSVTNNSAASYSFGGVYGVADANGSTTVTANGTDGIYIWGADLRPASQATGLIGPTYQRVVDAATYDAVGFLPYLAFDGLSWSMSTNSIDFSAGDKMTVFAGVRKLSDASATNYQTTVELSASTGISNGSYAEYSSGNVNGELGFYLRGTATVGFEPTTYNAPITLVTATSYDISQLVVAAEIKPRINGVLNQTGASGTDAGTGNFGNYPLFLGARNNSAGFLNGNLYSLIVRGAQSTQSQIEATESWVNGKTGAF